MNYLIRLTTLITCVSIFSGCAVHVRAGDHSSLKNYDSVFGGIDIDKAANVGDLSSVNGGIDIASNASAKEVETVNGGIDIGNNVKISSAETVNGGIEAGKGLNVNADLETVNGSVVVGRQSFVKGNILTVNGDIVLVGVEVGKNLETLNGDIELKDNTKVLGDLIYRKPSGFFSSLGDDDPVLVVDESSTISGNIHLYRPVDLRIAEGANIGEIKRHYSRK